MPKTFGIDVGNRIRSERKRNRLSMKELGSRVNLHESTISRYEQGYIQSLDIEKIEEFARALNVTPSYLMGWTDTKKRDALTDIINILTDAEIDELLNYANYLLNKRTVSK